MIRRQSTYTTIHNHNKNLTYHLVHHWTKPNQTKNHWFGLVWFSTCTTRGVALVAWCGGTALSEAES